MSPLLPLFLGHPKKRGRCSQTERLHFGRGTRNLRKNGVRQDFGLVSHYYIRSGAALEESVGVFGGHRSGVHPEMRTVINTQYFFRAPNTRASKDGINGKRVFRPRGSFPSCP